MDKKANEKINITSTHILLPNRNAHTHKHTQLSHLEMALILGLKILVTCNPRVSNTHAHAHKKGRGGCLACVYAVKIFVCGPELDPKMSLETRREEFESCWLLPLPAISVRERVGAHVWVMYEVCRHTLPLPISLWNR